MAKTMLVKNADVLVTMDAQRREIARESRLSSGAANATQSTTPPRAHHLRAREGKMQNGRRSC